MHRNDGIDFLRGISILAVVFLHCFIHMPFTQTLLPNAVINIIFRSGYYGVIIFFVISGFLITTNSLKRWGTLQNINWMEFYRMRFARIMPCLIALLIILSILNISSIAGFVIHTTTLTQAIFSTFTFQVNWLEAKTGYLPANWGVLWSLSIEEMFYLFFPIVCLLLRKPMHLILFLLVFVVLGPFARTVFTDNIIWGEDAYLSCMDGIAIGCLAALFIHYIKLTSKMLRLSFFLGLSLFTFIFIFRKFAYNLGITTIGLNVTILEIGTGLLLIAAHAWYINRNAKGSVWMRPFRWFGRNSYEIYLIHMFFVTIIAEQLFNEKQSGVTIGFWYVTVITLSGLVGHLTASYFSEPLNRWLRDTNRSWHHVLFWIPRSSRGTTARVQ